MKAMMQWFSQNHFTNEKDRQVASMLKKLIYVTMLAYSIVFCFGGYFKDKYMLGIIGVSILVQLVILSLLQYGYLFVSSWIFSLSILSTLTLIATFGQGYHDQAVLAFPIVLVFTSMTLNRRVFIINSGLMLVSICWLVFGEVNGWYIPVPYPAPYWVEFFMLLVIFLVFGFAIDNLSTNMRKNLERLQNEIDNRNNIETELRVIDDRYRFMANNVPDIIYSLDGEGKIVSINNSAFMRYGYNENDAIGKPFLNYIHPEDREIIIKSFLRAQDEKRKITTGLRFRIVSGNGSIYWFELNAQARFDNNNQYLGEEGVLRDITKRKQVEDELLRAKEKAEEHERTILESQKTARLGTYELNVSSGIFKTSIIMDDVFGFKEKYKHTIEEWVSYIHPEDRAMMADYLMNYVIASGNPVDKEFRIVKANDKTTRWMHALGKLEFDSNGNVTKLIGTAQDITEHKQAEETIIKSLREKETLIRELYHRTKNTMQVIRSMIALQANEYSENLEIQQLVEKTGDRIQAISLVHQMLYESQDLSQISIKNYIHELSLLILNSYMNSNDRIVINLQIDDQYFLLDTAIPLGLILNELITNSLNHAFPDNRKGIINITLSKEDSGNNILQYSDNGVGVVDGFNFRNNKTLGLKLVHSIGEQQMCGKVDIENNNGISYTLEFPSNLYKKRV
jgi:PAS domain S-box-containing protein